MTKNLIIVSAAEERLAFDLSDFQVSSVSAPGDDFTYLTIEASPAARGKWPPFEVYMTGQRPLDLAWKQVVEADKVGPRLKVDDISELLDAVAEGGVKVIRLGPMPGG